MRIVHTSDLHGEWRELPEGDVYVVTGDMLDNYPKVSMDAFGYSHRRLLPERERRLQLEWFERKFSGRGKTLRKFLPEACRDNPVVCVRGNHDFTDLGPMFGGDVHEVQMFGDSFEVSGLKFGGFRGINYIVGEWSDEYSSQYFDDRMHELPSDLDVVVTHAPPAGILDMFYDMKLGIDAYRRYLDRRSYDDSLETPKLCCFGHIHGERGTLEADGTVFSNAATTVNVIDLEV